MISKKSFNPRARAGRDDRQRHRPARHKGFNPRARAGRDSYARPAACWTSLFQSTRPRGARLDRQTISSLFQWFQSTRPRGARQCWIAKYSSPSRFQSTRPRGARLSPSWTNTNYSTKQSYIQAATKLTKITRPAVPQFRCQGTRANIVINRHHLPFARHRARQLAKPQGHKVSSHQNAPPFFANSSRGYIRAGYLLTHQ